ncbi:hypothetical protein N0V92_000591 [Colletotrichum tropicale]|nr:hypothetical protein N0V92_000591 [Colletotrichum tropicale]
MAAITATDPTFRAYKGTQAKRYDEGRPAYTPALYEAILKYHDESNGCRGTVVDVGCGPGRATRELARFFDNAIGVDPSENMIDTAKQVGGVRNTGNPIEYYVSPAERVADLEELPDGKVDLLTAAAALETDDLAQFELAPNVLSRTLYDDLALPWKLESAHPDFEESSYVRREWDRDGVLTDGEDFFGDSLEISLDILEKGYDTASTVTRWRAANPELAHGPDDCVKKTIAQLRKAAGPQSNGSIRGSTSTVLLLLKRR